MSKKRQLVSDLAREAGMELDEVLVTLWDAGFDEIAGPGDRLGRGEANRARRALGLATRREIASPGYWQERLGISGDQFDALLADLGIPDPFEGGRLRKKAINRLRGEERQHMARTAEAPVTAHPASTMPSYQTFRWEEVGHVKQLRYVTVDQVRNIHAALEDDFQGSPDPIVPAGVKSEDLLASAVHRPLTSVDETPKYPTVEMAAAALLHALVHNHPFHNGNKRTALVSMLVFLDENGMVLTCPEDNLFKLVLQLAQHSLVSSPRDELPDREVLAVARWLKAHVRWVEKGDRSIPWRRLRRILTAHKCEIQQVGGGGNRVAVSRVVLKRSGFFGRQKEVILTTSLHIIDDGRELDKGLIKTARQDLELDDEHGVDSGAFYDNDTVSPSEFIVRYRKTLRRLARL